MTRRMRNSALMVVFGVFLIPLAALLGALAGISIAVTIYLKAGAIVFDAFWVWLTGVRRAGPPEVPDRPPARGEKWTN